MYINVTITFIWQYVSKATMAPSVERYVPAWNRLFLFAAMWMVPASVPLHLMELLVIKVSFLIGNGLTCH